MVAATDVDHMTKKTTNMSDNSDLIGSTPYPNYTPPTMYPDNPDHTPPMMKHDHTLGTPIVTPSLLKTQPNLVPTRTYSEFLAGFGAAVINITVTFPLNKLMFRQQLHGISLKKAWSQLSHEGLHRLYRGLLPPLLQKTTSVALMFGMYDKSHIYLKQHFSQFHAVSLKAGAGIMAGCTELVLLPFERIQTVLQDRAQNKTYMNTMDVARSLRQYGFAEYYRGLTAVLLRNGPSNVMFFVGRDSLKNLFPNTDSTMLDLLQNFISGAILGATISTICFPLNVIKTRMQCKVGGRFLSVTETFSLIRNERRGQIKRLFRGIHINYTRSLVSWGIINASYEVFRDFLTEKHTYT